MLCSPLRHGKPFKRSRVSGFITHTTKVIPVVALNMHVAVIEFILFKEAASTKSQ
jgi:hypothetical protein